MAQQQLTQTSRNKWVISTYTGKETLCFTNASKHTDLKIAFQTNNTIEIYLDKETLSQTDFHHQVFTN